MVLTLLSGCATSSKFEMQHDGSYVIHTKRDTIFNQDAKDGAYEQASLLCPKGYSTDSGFKNAVKEYTLIVHCQK